ncbi:MAG: hypothetical protein ACR2HX_00875 [Pyrinomonadaceae bacterium]
MPTAAEKTTEPAIALTQQVRDLLLGRVGCVLRNGRRVCDLEAWTSQHLLLHSCVGSEGNIILIAALLVLALARHHTYCVRPWLDVPVLGWAFG